MKITRQTAKKVAARILAVLGAVALTVCSTGCSGPTQEQIGKQYDVNMRMKLEDVVDIKILKDGASVCRELIMLKVKANAAQRAAG